MGLRGAVGFLTRVPVGHDDRAWAAFVNSPVSLPLAGYVVGAALGVVLFFPAPTPTVTALYVCWLYLLTGVTHVDGLADLGDALVVHGTPEERRAVLKDTTVGVGGVLSVVVLVVALALAVVTLASDPAFGFRVVIVAEVTAKLSMATLVCVGTATHEGLASELTDRATPRHLAVPLVVALPVSVLTWPHPAGAVAVLAGLFVPVVVLRVSRRRFGGINGDVLGAANELARLVALHAGVFAWTQL